eukprot:13031719-Alexandrium_andersonii.AAC.1
MKLHPLDCLTLLGSLEATCGKTVRTFRSLATLSDNPWHDTHTCMRVYVCVSCQGLSDAELGMSVRMCVCANADASWPMGLCELVCVRTRALVCAHAWVCMPAVSAFAIAG